MNLSWLPAFLRPLRRSTAQQQQVDRETRQLALYHFPLCGYCLRVRRAIWRLNLHIELRNAADEARWRHELRDGGGRLQVPCLQIRHPDRTEWLYESDDIINYLRVRFAD
ncbi:MAG: glutathione S-transferase N-terminal domain-containing protein [Candidatus Thiodiazotropha sp.]